MKYLLTIILLLMGPVFCTAQTNLTAELHFTFLDVKGGLPEGFVGTMIQDRQGYIWMTTQRGLVRYDGYKPKVYTLGITDPYRMNVSTIYQDRKGRIWAGTGYGDLYLYDPGEDSFIHYPLVLTGSGSTSSLPIYYIKDDDLGRLWLTAVVQNTQKASIILFDPGTGKFTWYGKQERGKNYIDADLYRVFQDIKGDIWVSSDNGLYEFDNKNKRFTAHLATDDSTRQKGFFDITEDAIQPGVLWLGIAKNNKGLWRFDTGNDSATVFYHNPKDPASIASDTALKVMNDAKGNLWIGTLKGLSLFDRVKDNFINYYPTEKNLGYDNLVIDIVQDNDGNFWCQSVKGILYFNTQTREFTRITADPKKTGGLLSNNLLHTFLLDRRGTLWLGVGNSGVQWITRQPAGFIQYNVNQKGLHYFAGSEVKGFAKDADGNIWIGAQHGLYRWQLQTNSFTEIKFWKGNAVNESASHLMIDNNGKVWFDGGNNGDYGLDCYDPRTGKTKYYRNIKNDSTSLSSNDVFSIYEDRLGNIWVGTFGGGICRFDPNAQKFIQYPFIQNAGTNTQNHGALDDSQVATIFEDRGGTLWIGTTGGGLNRFNPKDGSFTSYKNIVPGFQYITGIYEDSQNRLWVGSYYGGFFQFNSQTGSVEKFTEKDGLLYDGANAILEDSSHNLWLTSARGITIFNTQTHQVRTLTTAGGLPDNKLDNFIYGIKISNREFLFSCDNGFIDLNPEDFNPDPNPPVVHIKSVSFTVPGSNSTRDSTIFVVDKKDISLSYNENRLIFDYVGLYYQQSALVKYAYKLEGYDKDWINAGTQRTVTYTNLSPGAYTFRVKAANSGGIWSSENPSVIITINPPWWKTWWAYFIYTFIFLGALRIFSKWRERNLRREKDKLEARVERRTKQLNESIESLKSTQSQLIQSEKMASLGELTAGIAHEIQNPLNFVNNFSEVNKELLEELKAERLKPKAETDQQNEDEIINDVIDNEEKIIHHGKRADAIVKSMLQHSRVSTGVKEPTDINALCDEYLRLSYHGLRAKDKLFNAKMETDFDESIGKINIISQDIGRVLLNLFNNAFYACTERSRSTVNEHTSTSSAEQACKPTVSVATRKSENNVFITVSDNGNGIPQKILDKIFQPFFTTKPTGQGTGLGLSLSYDIIKANGGEIKVETEEGKGSAFIIQLPVV